MGTTYLLVDPHPDCRDHRALVVRPRLFRARHDAACRCWTGSSSSPTWCGLSGTGCRRSNDTDEVEGYFLANRSLPWWAVGLSVMATQLSAITLVGTTGQGYADGMRFIQFYFGLPLAMIILSVTLVPFFYRAKVYTAYEYLERRFDVKTRTLASMLFLCSRGLSCGVIIAAPAVILSIILGWNLTLTILAIGLPTVVYTMVGGVQAVTWTDVKQMGVIVAGLLAAVAVLIIGLPDDVSVGQALQRRGRGRAHEPDRLQFRLDARPTRSGRGCSAACS